MSREFLTAKTRLPRTSVVFCGILCIVLIFAPILSVQGQGLQQKIEQLKQQRHQVQQQHEKVVKEKNRLNNLQLESQKRLTDLETNLVSTDNNIQDSEQRLTQATQQLEQLQTDLASAQVTYAQRQTATISRLRYLQRSPQTQGWAVLLTSRNLNDFLSRRHHLKIVYEADKQNLVTLREQAIKIKQHKIEVEQQKNEIALIRQQLLAEKADFQNQAQLQTQMIERLNSDRTALEAAQTRLEKDSLAIKSLIQQKVQEMEAAAAQAKARNASRNFVSGSGIMAFPTNAPISSPFGWRTHPILGYRRLHTGMDFAANYGTTIRAADSGTVIFSGWYGGYGQAVIISHGKGITTLYGHNSQLYVSQGQTVKRGQPISAVGSTGLSTGPHLHFEVRKHGSPVNPADYL